MDDYEPDPKLTEIKRSLPPCVSLFSLQIK